MAREGVEEGIGVELGWGLGLGVELYSNLWCHASELRAAADFDDDFDDEDV